MTQLTEEERLAIGYLHYPLPQHGAARSAARAAVCAEDQGKFAEMHGYLFQAQEWKSGADWQVIAKRVNVPQVQALLDCMESEATAQRLQRHRALAQGLNVPATPTWVFRDYSLVGARAVMELRDRLAEYKR